MEWIFENWYMIIATIAVLGIVVAVTKSFLDLPTDQQIEKVKQWALYAVIAAEKEMGSGTGKIKLKMTYDMFLNKFPWLAKVISFETFSMIIDEALEEMEKVLSSNENVKKYVESGKE